MVSNKVTINQSALDINPKGITKILGFKGRFIIPFSHIKSITRSYGIIGGTGMFWRTLGTSFFGNYIGFFSKNRTKAYINLKRSETPILIELTNEDVDQLILGIEDEKDFIEKISKKQPSMLTDVSKGDFIPTKTISKAQKTIYYTINFAILLAFPMVLFGLISSIFPSTMGIIIPIISILGAIMGVLIAIGVILSVKNRK